MSAPRILVLLWACAILRAALPLGAAPASTSPSLPGLPARLDGERGQPVPLAASERVLGGAGGVRLERRRYGTTQVALLGSRGLKELHPPAVCLRAAGLTVVERGESPSRVGCLGWLRVRAGEREQHFHHVFFDGRTVTCSFWRRTALAAGQQLAGIPSTWWTLQVMDADRGRSQRRLLTLLAALRAPPISAAHHEGVDR